MNFPNLQAAKEAGILSGSIQSGIGLSKETGAVHSVVIVPGRYPDYNKDATTLFYVGTGGFDRATGKQISDQKWNKKNAAFFVNIRTGETVNALVKQSDNTYECVLHHVEDFAVNEPEGYKRIVFRLVRMN